MALKNYTTNISSGRTIGEIQQILSKHGATAIMTEYKDGEATALSFKINTTKGEVGIKLPSNIDRVLKVLKSQKQKNGQIKDTKEQATRVAWRIIKDWIEAQMAILEIEMVDMEEIFLPYVINRNGQTLYQAFQSNQLMIEESGE